MLKRPLILKLFTLFLFLDPFLRNVFISIEREFPLSEVFQKTLALQSIDFFNFWLLFPLSGLLLISVKLYGYILFIILQFYSLYFHLNYVSFSWPYLSATPSAAAYVLLALNVFMVAYFLMPLSRRIFLDKNLRWWERGSRYTINEPCYLSFASKSHHVTLCDLAFGGCQVESKEELELGIPFSIEFDIFKKNISLRAEVVRRINSEDNYRYGVKFLFESKLEELRLRFIMLIIGLNGKYSLYR